MDSGSVMYLSLVCASFGVFMVAIAYYGYKDWGKG